MEGWPEAELAAIALRLGVVGRASPPLEVTVMASDGVRLRALDWGGAGPHALLLHGGALTARTWDYVCVGLRDAFRLFALDLRGHGASDWADSYAVERLAQDAAEIAEAVGAPLHLVGMSLGGVAAGLCAAERPELVRSLALVDVGPGVVFEASANMRKFMQQTTRAPSVEAVVEAALRASPRSDPERLAYRMRTLLRPAEDGSWTWKRDVRRPVDYPHILAHVERLGERLAGFPAPFLVVRGGRSRTLPREAAIAFARQVPQGGFCEVGDAGHNVQEDNPVGLAAALGAFWRAADPAPQSPPASSLSGVIG